MEDTLDPTLEQYTLYQLEDATLRKEHGNPDKVTLKIEGKSVLMDIDTGASLSLVSEHTYQELWPTVRLQETSVTLTTYTSTQLKLPDLINATRLNEGYCVL